MTAKAVAKGQVLAASDIAFKKPGDGISARLYKDVLGKKGARDLLANHKLAWDDLQ